MPREAPCYHRGMPPSPHEGQPSPAPRALRLFVGAHAFFLVLWALVVATSGPQQNDWALLKAVADRFVAGDTANLYARGSDLLLPGYFWIYPPFVLFPLAVLAPLPPLGAYLLLALAAVAATARSLVLLGRLRPLGSAREDWALAVFCSAPLLTTVVTGQFSGLILYLLVSASARWEAGGEMAACALLGLLVAKPNWGLAFGLMMLVRRDWKGAATMAGVGLLACASGLLAGPDLWRDFFRAATLSIEMQGSYDAYTIITMRGFLEALFPQSLAWPLWAASAAMLLAAAVRVWSRPAPLLEHAAAAALLVISANPYAHFYDALVLVLPATVWWTGRDRWPAGAWRGVGLLIAATWIGEQASWSWPMLLGMGGFEVELPFSLVGPSTAAWLLAWALTVRR